MVFASTLAAQQHLMTPFGPSWDWMDRAWVHCYWQVREKIDQPIPENAIDESYDAYIAGLNDCRRIIRRLHRRSE